MEEAVSNEERKERDDRREHDLDQVIVIHQANEFAADPAGGKANKQPTHEVGQERPGVVAHEIDAERAGESARTNQREDGVEEHDRGGVVQQVLTFGEHLEADGRAYRAEHRQHRGSVCRADQRAEYHGSAERNVRREVQTAAGHECGYERRGNRERENGREVAREQTRIDEERRLERQHRQEDVGQDGRRELDRGERLQNLEVSDELGQDEADQYENYGKRNPHPPRCHRKDGSDEEQHHGGEHCGENCCIRHGGPARGATVFEGR